MAKKNKYEDLETTLKSNMENMTDDELRSKVSEVALYRSARQDQMKKDPDIKQARESLNLLTKDFKDDLKGADLTISYAQFLLEARGKA